MGHPAPPVMTEHAEERRIHHGIDMRQIGITLVFGLGVIQDDGVRLLIGPDVTLVINPDWWNIVTVYPNKNKHRFIALRSYLIMKRETKNEVYLRTEK